MRAIVSNNNIIAKLRPVVRVIANSMISVLILHDLLSVDREYESLLVFLPEIVRLDGHGPVPSEQMEAIVVGGTSRLYESQRIGASITPLMVHESCVTILLRTVNEIQFLPLKNLVQVFLDIGSVHFPLPVILHVVEWLTQNI